jgi:DNA-binding transcriptional LysR family regulator
VSILPRAAVAKEAGIRMLATVPLAIGGLVRPIAIIHRRGKRLTPAVARFIDVLQKADDVRGEAPDRPRVRMGGPDRDGAGSP